MYESTKVQRTRVQLHVGPEDVRVQLYVYTYVQINYDRYSYEYLYVVDMPTKVQILFVNSNISTWGRKTP